MTAELNNAVASAAAIAIGVAGGTVAHYVYGVGTWAK